MFNYTHEIILNDLDRVIVGGAAYDESTSAWVAATNGVADGNITIKRGGNYDLGNLHNCAIHVTKGHKGTNAKATITVPQVDVDSPMIRLSVFVKAPGAELVEYAMPNWYEFGKPILVEVKNDGTAAGLAQSLYNALVLAKPYDNKFYNVSVSGTSLVIELAENWMDFDEINIKAYDGLVDAFVPLETEPTITYVAAVPEFGTAKWIVENLRFPSYPNLRFNRLYADEAPIPGAIYDEYAFEYDVERTVPGGLNTVSEVCPSRTNHVIYVLSTIAGDLSDGASNTFEGAILEAATIDDERFGGASKAAAPSGHTGESIITILPKTEEEETE